MINFFRDISDRRKNFIASLKQGKYLRKEKKKCQCFIYYPLSPDYKSIKKSLRI